MNIDQQMEFKNFHLPALNTLLTQFSSDPHQASFSSGFLLSRSPARCHSVPVSLLFSPPRTPSHQVDITTFHLPFFKSPGFLLLSLSRAVPVELDLAPSESHSTGSGRPSFTCHHLSLLPKSASLRDPEFSKSSSRVLRPELTAQLLCKVVLNKHSWNKWKAVKSLHMHIIMK